MPRLLYRALFLSTTAALFAACLGAAEAVETWVGSDGEIRVVPGTEDPVPPSLPTAVPPRPVPLKQQTAAPPHSVHAAAPKGATARVAKPPKTAHPRQQAAAKPAHGKPGPVDLRPTGAIAPANPGDPTATDQQTPPAIKPAARGRAVAVVPTLATVAADPGNPVISVDPSADTQPKTNEPDEGVYGPAPDAGVIGPQSGPGALPTNPIDPNQQTGAQMQMGPTTPAGVAAQNQTPAVNANGRPAPAPMRLRSAVPPPAPVMPVQPQQTAGVTGSIAQAPQLATTPNPRIGPDDPLTDPQATAYDAAGLRINSFVWRPAIELSAGATSNIQSASGGTSSSALRLAPELIGQSDWSRHQLGIDVHGSFTEFPQDWALYRPTVSATVNGRIDFSEDTRLALKASYGLDKLPSTSALSAAGTTGAGLQQTATGSASLTRDIGRFALTLRGEVDRTDYQLSQQQAAATSTASLNNTDLIGALRGTYNLSSGVKPFVEIQADARRYDGLSIATATTFQPSHDTTGAAGKGGVTLDLGPILTGEASAGYGVEVPATHALQMLRAFTVDNNLIWSPTRSTRITVSTVSALEPSLIAGASGAVSRTVGVKLANDLFRNLTVDLGGSYLERHYTGVFRTENLTEVTSGLTWKINPRLQTFVRGTFDGFSSSAHTDDYNTATVFAGVRLQQ